MRVIRPMFLCLTLAFVPLALAGAAAAQSETQRPAGATSFVQAEAALAALERGLSQIERSRRITEQLDPETALDAYYKELRRAYEGTMQAIVEEAGKAEGTTPQARRAAAGVGKKLEAWEREVAALRARSEKVVHRLTAINVGLRDASIMIAPELLKKMPAGEVRELRQWLTPEAIRKYQALDSSLFTEGAARLSPLPPAAVTVGLTAGCPACGRLSSRPLPSTGSGSLLGALGDLLVPEAEAAVAVTCVATCSATPELCIPCVAAAVGVGAFLVTRLDAAFDDCNRRPTRVGRAVCKAAVVLAFLVIIA